MNVVCRTNDDRGWPFVAEFFEEGKVVKKRVYSLTNRGWVKLAVENGITAFEFGLIFKAHKKMMGEGDKKADIFESIKVSQKKSSLKEAFAKAVEAFHAGAVDIVYGLNGEVYLSRY